MKPRWLAILMLALLIAAGIAWGPATYRSIRYRRVETLTIGEGNDAIVVTFRWHRFGKWLAVVEEKGPQAFSFSRLSRLPVRLERMVGGTLHTFWVPGTVDGRADLQSTGAADPADVKRVLEARKRDYPQLDWSSDQL